MRLLYRKIQKSYSKILVIWLRYTCLLYTSRSAEILSDAAQSLEKAGADYIVICTNTMHKVADEIKKHIHIPILHIAEMTAVELEKSGITKVGLLGTKYTMQQDFYKCILENRGIHVVIPLSLIHI